MKKVCDGKKKLVARLLPRYILVNRSFTHTLRCIVSDPDDLASGGEGGVGVMPPAVVQGAEPPLKLEY